MTDNAQELVKTFVALFRASNQLGRAGIATKSQSQPGDAKVEQAHRELIAALESFVRGLSEANMISEVYAVLARMGEQAEKPGERKFYQECRLRLQSMTFDIEVRQKEASEPGNISTGDQSSPSAPTELKKGLK